MIKFFRGIRQNLLAEGNTAKYLKYAIGEIGLVVLGILIALQINNWNQQRLLNNEMKASFNRLLSDLNDDLNHFQMMDSVNTQYSAAARTMEGLLVKTTAIADVAEMQNLTIGTFNLDYNRGTYESMLTTGLLYKSDYEELNKAITAYYRDLDDVSDIFDSMGEALLASRFTDAYLPFDYLTNTSIAKNAEFSTFLVWMNNPESPNYQAVMRYLSLYEQICEVKKNRIASLLVQNTRLRNMLQDVQ